MTRLLIVAVEQVTTNPKAFDTWLNRVYTIIPILAAIGVGVRILTKRFHKSVSEIVELKSAAMKTGVELVIDQRVTRVEEALKAHTDQEAGIVRQVVADELRPVRDMQNQLLGRVDTLTAMATIEAAKAPRTSSPSTAP